MSNKLNREIIDEILCRFIVNLPLKELAPDRIFFHVQEAYWFYLDFILPNKDLKQPYKNEKNFGQILFDHLPNSIKLFDPGDYYLFYKKFHHYQSQIPVYGAILLNQSLDKVLLVMNWKQTSYGFPKGKINQNESEIDCAAREVWEEIGFSITNGITEKDFIEMNLYGHQKNKYYILAGVDERVEFKTKTRYEIGRIEWVRIETIENSIELKKNLKNPFKNVLPFIDPLKLWLARFKGNERRHTAEEIKIPLNCNGQRKPQKKIEYPKEISDFETNLQTISEKKQQGTETENNFKEITIKIESLMISYENKEVVSSLEYKSERKERQNSLNNDKKVKKILQNKEKKFENLQESAFEKKLKEISNNFLNSIQQTNASIEISPFLNFMLDTSALKKAFDH